jgi:hypothetical protein
MFLSPAAALILGILFKFRVLPFLKNEMILSGGRYVLTSDFANSMASIFFIFAIGMFLFALGWLVIRRRKENRRK